MKRTLNVLFICSWFPPDTTIGAVRPYMFAKYLALAGHDVTVLRLGEFDKAPDKSNFYSTEYFEVISALGPDCPVERFLRGDHDDNGDIVKNAEAHKGFAAKIKQTFSDVIPQRSNIRSVYNIINDQILAGKNFKKQKKALEDIKASRKKIDIIFSTYSNLENIYAAHYAKQLFGAKWIMDFRDSPIKRGRIYLIRNLFVKRAVVRELKSADLCVAVTNRLSNVLNSFNTGTETIAISNGYEPVKEKNDAVNDSPEIFTFCFTGGTLYDAQFPAVRKLAECISYLCQNDLADKSRLRLIYAGNYFDEFAAPFKEFGLESILDNRGYCDRQTVAGIQDESDIFLNLSWHSKTCHGGVTGKFYEGIRAHKYILSVIAADFPGSELYSYNAEYNYGFCYESCRGEDHFNDMCNWIAQLYDRKMKTGQVLYSDNPKLEDAFDYRTLTDKLMEQMERLCV